MNLDIILDFVYVIMCLECYMVKYIFDIFVYVDGNINIIELRFVFYWEYNDVEKIWMFYL